MTQSEKKESTLGRVTLDLTLVVRRTINATPEKLFRAWTTPELLTKWWGPAGIECPAAEVDLRVGGRYRLANKMPDGTITWITGEFERIDPPFQLVYSWHMGKANQERDHKERVTVRFKGKGTDTEIIITHEHIADLPSRSRHELGWLGCLDGLETLTRQ